MKVLRDRPGSVGLKKYAVISSMIAAIVSTVCLSWQIQPATAAVLVDTGIPFTAGFGGLGGADQVVVDDFTVVSATTVTRIELLMFTIALGGPDPTIRVQVTDAIGPGTTAANLLGEYTASVGNPLDVSLVHYVSIPTNLQLGPGTYYLVVSNDVVAGNSYANWVSNAPNGTPGRGMSAEPRPPHSSVDTAFPPASKFLSLFAPVDLSFRIVTADATTPASVDTSSKMYFSNIGASTVLRSNLDGTGIETLAAGQNNVLATAVDADAGKLYWTELQTGIPAVCCGGATAPGHWAAIKRANLDGSNAEVILSKGHGVKHPDDLKLDIAAGKLYWTDGGDRSNGGRIYRANLDGSNVELLLDVISLRAPDFSQATGFEFGQVSGLALDPGAGQIYWADYFGGDIHRALLDGSNIEQLVTGLTTPRGIALDPASAMMYWATGDFGNQIMRATMDGIGAEVIVDKKLGTRLKQPFSVALDTASNHVYWADMDSGKIQRSSLDGSGVVTLVELGAFRRGKFRPDSIAGLSLNLVGAVAGPATPSADLELQLSSPLSSILVGDSLTYTITATNWGPDTATGITLTDALPASALLVSAPANCSASLNILSCSLGSLAAGASASVQVTASFDAAGVVSNAASVAGIEADPVAGNNQAVLDTVVDVATPVVTGTSDLVAVITRFRSKAKNGVVDTEVQVDITNQGTATVSSAFTATAFFSTDAFLDAGDLLLQSWDIAGLGVNSTSSLKTRNSIASAVGFIIVIVDPGEVVAESDEANNVDTVIVQ